MKKGLALALTLLMLLQATFAVVAEPLPPQNEQENPGTEFLKENEEQDDEQNPNNQEPDEDEKETSEEDSLTMQGPPTGGTGGGGGSWGGGGGSSIAIIHDPDYRVLEYSTYGNGETAAYYSSLSGNETTKNQIGILLLEKPQYEVVDTDIRGTWANIEMKVEYVLLEDSEKEEVEDYEYGYVLVIKLIDPLKGAVINGTIDLELTTNSEKRPAFSIEVDFTFLDPISVQAQRGNYHIFDYDDEKWVPLGDAELDNHAAIRFDQYEQYKAFDVDIEFLDGIERDKVDIQYMYGRLGYANYEYFLFFYLADGISAYSVDQGSILLQINGTRYFVTIEDLEYQGIGKRYNVKYNADNSTSGNVPATVTTYSGLEVAVPSNTGGLKRTNYTFAGWTNGSATYKEGDLIMVGASDIVLYAAWTPNSTPSTGNGGRGPGGGGGGAKTTPTTPQTTTFKPVTTTEATAAAQTALATAKANGTATASVKLTNVGEISAEALSAMTKTANMPVQIVADSLTADSKAVDVRITLSNPGTDKALKFSASTTSASARGTRSFFEKWFQNKLAVISFDQKGSFGKNASIAARVDLTGMDTTKLKFYAYDSTTNSYKALATPNYSIDANGYLRFTTEYAGDIVVSEGALLKK